MKTSRFFVYYLVSNHVQVLASSTIHRLEFRGGDIFIDDALTEKTQCNLENEGEAVKSQSSLEIQTDITEIVDIENHGTKENFKIIEIVKNKHDVPKGSAESSPGDDKFDMLHKPIRVKHILGSSGQEHGVNSSDKKQYSTNLKEGSVVHEGNKNVAFVSTSKAGRKSQILDHKISKFIQTFYRCYRVPTKFCKLAETSSHAFCKRAAGTIWPICFNLEQNEN
jgi:hypothetical protein